MRKPATFLTAFVCGAWLLAAGIAWPADSGFLPDYAQLHDTKDANGNPLRTWISPKFNKTNYQRIFIERVAYYPEPRGSDQVSDEALRDIQNYMDNQLRTVALAGIPQTTEPGPGVARVKLAITAVDTSATALKPWQIIPAALVIQGAEAATGKRKRNAVLHIEALIADSVSNEPLAESVRAAKGVTVPDSRTQVTLDTVRGQIDSWARGVASLVGKTLHP
jgi:hypothetical protein